MRFDGFATFPPQSGAFAPIQQIQGSSLRQRALRPCRAGSSISSRASSSRMGRAEEEVRVVCCCCSSHKRERHHPLQHNQPTKSPTLGRKRSKPIKPLQPRQGAPSRQPPPGSKPEANRKETPLPIGARPGIPTEMAALSIWENFMNRQPLLRRWSASPVPGRQGAIRGY